jgi:sarcosine oxidase subunit alpha
MPRERLWKVRARSVVLATGAHERGIAYANNDLPGTMLAGALRTYIDRYAVRPGTRAVVFANNDQAYAAAFSLQRAGIEVAAIVDPRGGAALDGALPLAARDNVIPILARSVITGAHGRLHVTAVDVAPLAGGVGRRIECDLVALSGGWNPAVHLFSQARGKLRYDEALATFVPDHCPAAMTVAGAANGSADLSTALHEGHAAGIAAAAQEGFAATASLQRPEAAPVASGAPLALWSTAPVVKGAKRFVDWQNDVTVDDVALAAREGYSSVEHLKRYTTLGMGTDQGKISNVVGLALLAGELERPIASVGTTTFRPPYTPVTLGAFPGHDAGPHVEPSRFSSIHDWHVAHGARFVNAGLWKRPHSYPRTGESAGRRGAARSAQRPHQRRHRRRLDARQDRAAGRRRRGIPEPRLHQSLGHASSRALPLRRDAARRRHRARRRHDVAPRVVALPAHDDDGQRRCAVLQYLESLLQTNGRSSTSTHRGHEQWSAAAVAGPRARDVLAKSWTSTCRTRRFRSSLSRAATFARPPARSRPAFPHELTRASSPTRFTSRRTKGGRCGTRQSPPAPASESWRTAPKR